MFVFVIGTEITDTISLQKNESYMLQVLHQHLETS